MKKVEIGTIILAIVSGAVWLGELNGRISSLERDYQTTRTLIIEELDKALSKIQSKATEIGKILSDHSKIPGTEVSTENWNEYQKKINSLELWREDIEKKINELKDNFAKMNSNYSNIHSRVIKIEDKIKNTSNNKQTIQEALIIGKPTQSEGFKFEPIKCISSGNKMTCSILITNKNDEEIELMIKGSDRGNSTFLFDNYRNQYPVTINIGQRQNSWYLTQKFVPNLPIKVNFISENVKSTATYCSLNIQIRKFKQLVTLRDIPITK